MDGDAPTPVTIVVPVYRDRGDAEACLTSVMRHAPAMRTPAEVLIVEDGSPDPDLVGFVTAFAAGEHELPVRLVRNEVNLGFVASANRGMALAPGDVVLLNADTVVTAGWLDELAAAAAAPGVGSATPLSNFGSLCTLPEPVLDRFGLAGDRPDIDGCAAFIAEHTAACLPEVLTGVGFCLYLPRTALDAIGDFDVETFGRGYGEEVDWCLRAAASGLRHLAVDTAFVYHRGGGSFGAEGRETGKAAGSARLHQRYPDLRDRLKEQRRRRPMAVAFTALELALVARDPGRGHVLHVLHSPPHELGGTEKHVLALVDALWDEWDASLLFPVPDGFMVRTLIAGADGVRHQRDHFLPGDVRKITAVHDDAAAEAAATALDLVRPDVVHVQNLVGHSLAPLPVLAAFPGTLVWSVRDLYVGCPHHWLLTPDLDPCGIPDDLEVCARCLPVTRGLDLEDLADFRMRMAEHADRVDAWVVASRSAGDYLLRALAVDESRITVIPHGALVDPSARRTEPPADAIFADPLRVAFVGVSWDKKGRAVVSQVADGLGRLDVEIHHFGKEKLPLSDAVVTHGPYDNHELADRLDEAGIAAVLLPAPFAETFGHVVTEAFLAGRPVIGTSYGAVGERIRAERAGWTVDPADPDAIVALLANLAANREEVLRASAAAVAAPVPTVPDTAPAYAELYRTRPPSPRPQEGSAAMDPQTERLRHRLAALTAVNAELYEQIDHRPRKDGSDTATMPPSGEEETAHRPEPEQPAMAPTPTGAAGSPRLTRRSDGVVFFIDSTGRRKVRSGMLATVLQKTYGAAVPEGDDAYGPLGDVDDLEILRGPSGDGFIVVDGTRRKLKGLPVPRVISAEEVAAVPEGPALDVAGPLLSASAQPAVGLAGQLRRVLRGIRRRLR